jgi:ribonuclease R
VKLYAYLKAQIENEERIPYPALVTDLRNFGFFVDVPTLGLSGIVPLSSMQDDFYILEPARNHIVGRHSHRVIKMGDNLTVEVYRVDSFKKQVDFRLVRTEADKERQPGGERHGAPERRGRKGGRQEERRSGGDGRQPHGKKPSTKKNFAPGKGPFQKRRRPPGGKD